MKSLISMGVAKTEAIDIINIATMFYVDNTKGAKIGN